MKIPTFISLIVLFCCASIQSGPVPGVTGSCLGAGYNLVTQQCSFQPLFSFSYDRGREWENPYTGAQEQWPDQVSVIDLDSAQVDSEQVDIQSWSEYVSMLDKSLSISVGLSYDGVRLGLAFTHAKGTYDMFSKSASMYFAQQTRKVTLYKAMLLRAAYAPQQGFADMVNALPPTCSDKLCFQRYCQVVNTFGTHAVTAVVMGGYQNVTAAYNKTLATHESKTWVSNQIDISLSFLKFQAGQLGVGVGRNVSKSQISSKFLQNAHLSTHTMGGNLALARNFTTWLPSVPDVPVSILPYDGELTPLYDLVVPYDAAAVERVATLRNVVIHYIETGGVCPTSAVDFPFDWEKGLEDGKDEL